MSYVPSNSSTTPLPSSGEFVGEWVFVPNLGRLVVAVKSDTAATLYLEFNSSNQVGPNGVASSLPYSVLAGINKVQSLTVTRTWMRVRLVNSATTQTYLDLSCMLGPYNILSAPLNLKLAQDADAIVTRSIPAELDLAQGKLSGFSKNNKLGKNSLINTNSVPEFITEQGGVYTGFPLTDVGTLSLVSTSANDTAGGSGAREITIFGLNEDWEPISESVSLNGLTPVATVQQFRRAHTMFLSDSGDMSVASPNNIGLITAYHTAVPANVFLTILPNIGSSNYAVYTVPAGKTGIITNYFGDTRRSAGASCEGYWFIRTDGMSPRRRQPFEIRTEKGLSRSPYGGLSFPEKTDIAPVIDFVSNNGVTVIFGFDIILIDN